MGSPVLMLMVAAALAAFIGTIFAMCVRYIVRAVRAPRTAGTDVRCAKCGYTIAPRSGGLGICPECGEVLSMVTITTPRGRLAEQPTLSNALMSGAIVIGLPLFLVARPGSTLLVWSSVGCAIGYLAFAGWATWARRKAERAWVVPPDVQAMIDEAVRAAEEGREKSDTGG